jgi:hypothetical protein
VRSRCGHPVAQSGPRVNLWPQYNARIFIGNGMTSAAGAVRGYARGATLSTPSMACPAVPQRCHHEASKVSCSIWMACYVPRNPCPHGTLHAPAWCRAMRITGCLANAGHNLLHAASGRNFAHTFSAMSTSVRPLTHSMASKRSCPVFLCCCLCIALPRGQPGGSWRVQDSMPGAR